MAQRLSAHFVSTVQWLNDAKLYGIKLLDRSDKKHVLYPPDTDSLTLSEWIAQHVPDPNQD